MDIQTIGMANANRDPTKHKLTPINDIGIAIKQHKQGINGRQIILINNLQRQRAIHIQMPINRHIPRATREVAQHNPSIPTTPTIPIRNSNIGGMTHTQRIKLQIQKNSKKIIKQTSIRHVINPISSIPLYRDHLNSYIKFTIMKKV